MADEEKGNKNPTCEDGGGEDCRLWQIARAACDAAEDGVKKHGGNLGVLVIVTDNEDMVRGGVTIHTGTEQENMPTMVALNVLSDMAREVFLVAVRQSQQDRAEAAQKAVAQKKPYLN